MGFVFILIINIGFSVNRNGTTAANFLEIDLGSAGSAMGGAYVSLAPKPIHGDWNGSGAHINFSTKRLREKGGKRYITNIIKLLMDSHEEHIDEYGIDNELRLTGEHETQHIDVFSSGDSDRGASIRIPPATAETYTGYLEDRRPAANIDPYRAVGKLVETVGTVDCLVGV